MTKKSDVASWPVGHRRCLKCKNIKPFSCFHKHSGCMFGVNTVCNTCRKPLSRASYSNQSLQQRLYHTAKSRATLKGIPFDIELEDIVVPDVCPVFGWPFVKGNQKQKATLDRIDPTKGYVNGNVCVMSGLANMMKSVATKEELHIFGKWACEIL